jgi:hypothetical protein
VTTASKPGTNAPEDAEQEDFCDAGTVEEPLENHPDYLTKWTYALYQRVGGTSSNPPAWYATATDLSDADGVEYLWSKDNPGDRWTLVYDREKQADVYNRPAPVVTSYYYHSSKATAEGQLRAVATISAPPDDFGYTGLQWLVMSSRLSWNGRKYEVETRRQGAPAWDTDIYATGS